MPNDQTNDRTSNVAEMTMTATVRGMESNVGGNRVSIPERKIGKSALFSVAATERK